LLLLAAAAGARGAQTAIVPTARDSGIEIAITNPFEQGVVSAGCQPLRVRIVNRTGGAGRWVLETRSRADYSEAAVMVSTHTFEVEARGERTFEVYAPVIPAGGGYVMPRIGCRVSGPAVTGNSHDFGGVSPSGYNNPRTRFVAMTDALGVSGFGVLSAQARTGSVELCGTSIDPGLLPSDWRGLSGIEELWITPGEWGRLDAAQRAAMREWVALGGALTFFLSPGEAIPVDGQGADRAATGLGTVRSVAWNGSFADPAMLIDQLRNGRGRDKQLTEGYIARDHSRIRGSSYTALHRWKLAADLGPLVVSAGLIVLFALVFAAVVGPVNLFVLARKKKQHLVFVTTPLISLAASVLLAVVILLRDGVGGAGGRLGLLMLLPGENKAVLVQEQASRTGVLLARAFTATEPAVMMPVNLGEDAAAPRGYFVEHNRTRSGDWFASRSLQGQLIQAVRPTRAEIRLLPGTTGAPPRAVSGFNGRIDTFVCCDAAGKYWKADRLEPGRPVELRPARPEDANLILSEARASAGACLGDLLTRVPRSPGTFCARAGQLEEGLVDSLPAIRWKKDVLLVAGPLTAGEAVP
jgi:hypothetical protein